MNPNPRLRLRLFFRRLPILAVLLIGLLPLSGLRAQTAANDSITITVAVPTFIADGLTESTIAEFFKPFEAAHPGVHVRVVSKDARIPPAAAGLDAHLKAVQDYASAADVVYASSDFMSPEAARAGYFFDLAPLISSDKTINADDFYPAVWKSFQWDNGVWALPTGADGVVLSYLPSAFDAVGLSYPTAKWTIDDLANAVRKLAQKDASGKVTVPGIAALGRASRDTLLQSLIGDNLYDESVLPNTPKLDSPNTAKVLDAWNQLQKDGLLDGDANAAPLRVEPLSFSSFTLGAGPISVAAGGTSNATPASSAATPEKPVLAALPGGRVGLSTSGYAVSGGTLHAAEAYALAVYLTLHPEATDSFNSISPARKSLAGQANNNPTNSIGPRRPPLAPEAQPLLDQALANGLSSADMRFTDYIDQALTNMQKNNQTADVALAAIEVQALKDQQTAAASKAKTVIAVATPIPIVVAPGKITLKFGMASNFRIVTSDGSSSPVQDQWNRLAADFAASDPLVGRVAIESSNTTDLAKNAAAYDCFTLPFNAVPGAKTTNLLNLDPFLDADKTFDRNDIIGGLLAQIQQDNKTWALPLLIDPQLLSYDSQQFAAAGVPEPKAGWTFSAFVDALKALKGAVNGEPFVPMSPGGTHLLMLIAAAGGLPLDMRADPPAVHFTDAANVDAIRQVLDLAKNSYIKYSALGSLGGFMFALGGEAPHYAITTAELGLPRPVIVGAGTPTPDTHKLVNYPTGSTYNAISYSVTTAYISATAQNADACYRWISTVSKHPELFSQMPASRSLLNNPATLTAQGSAAVAAYKQIDALLQDSHTITFPSLFQGGATPVGFLIQHWLYEAFDAYVLHSTDLDTALKDAQTYADAFLTCAANIVPSDAGSDGTNDRFQKAYIDCAVKADPRLADFAKGIR